MTLNLRVFSCIHGKTQGFWSISSVLSRLNPQELVFIERDPQDYARIAQAFQEGELEQTHSETTFLLDFQKTTPIHVFPVDTPRPMLMTRLFHKLFWNPRTIWPCIQRWPRNYRPGMSESDVQAIIDQIPRLPAPIYSVLYDNREDHMALQAILMAEDHLKAGIHPQGHQLRLSFVTGPAHADRLKPKFLSKLARLDSRDFPHLSKQSGQSDQSTESLLSRAEILQEIKDLQSTSRLISARISLRAWLKTWMS